MPLPQKGRGHVQDRYIGLLSSFFLSTRGRRQKLPSAEASKRAQCTSPGLYTLHKGKSKNSFERKDYRRAENRSPPGPVGSGIIGERAGSPLNTSYSLVSAVSNPQKLAPLSTLSDIPSIQKFSTPYTFGSLSEMPIEAPKMGVLGDFGPLNVIIMPIHH